MKNEMVIKTYDIDYSFIINNYLDKEMWDKTWTLLVYKNTRVELSLYQIRCKRPTTITFFIKVDTGEYSDTNSIDYDLENSNINVLKKQINGCIRTGIQYCERFKIQDEDGYKNIQNAEREERDMLREIAEEYLDDNGITLNDVREAYIDKYVDDNSKTYTYLSNYIDGRKYITMNDLWLVFAKITNDDELCKIIENKNQYDELFEEKQKEINEFIDLMNSEEDSEKYQEYIADMKDELFAI